MHPLRNSSCRALILEQHKVMRCFAGSIRTIRVPRAYTRQMAKECAACINYTVQNEDADERLFGLKVLTLIPWLLLQSPKKRTSDREVADRLKRDLACWRRGDLKGLADRARALAHRQKEKFVKRESSVKIDPDEPRLPPKMAETVRIAISSGNISRAGSMISSAREGSGPVPITPEIREKLQLLHPEPLSSVTAPPPHGTPEPHKFDIITDELVRKLAARIKGAQGGSGMKNDLLRSLCRCGGPEGDSMRRAVASLAVLIATVELPKECLAPLTMSRLVALPKEGDAIRPIGIGEALRRLLGKIIMAAVKTDVLEVCGAAQLAGGLSSGCEAAAQALQSIWDGDESEVMLLVDASNAFNRMNRAEALHTVWRECPALGPTLQNLYGHDSELLLEDGSAILSREGTTQGCPLGMAMFAIASMPLIQLAGRIKGARQCWYADDSAGIGSVSGVHEWLTCLREHGPKYGYNINLAKTVAVVKPAARKEFERQFADEINTGLLRVVDGSGSTPDCPHPIGQRYLGVGVGSGAFRRHFIEGKVNQFVKDVENVSKFALDYPHEAHAIFVKSLLPKWLYVMQTTRTEPEAYLPLRDAVSNTLLPALHPNATSSDAKSRAALPIEHGGLSLIDPVERAKLENEASLLRDKSLVEAILHQNPKYQQDLHSIRCASEKAREVRATAYKKQANDLMAGVSKEDRRAWRSLQEARATGACSWLSATPICSLGFAMHPQEFRDLTALRLNIPLSPLCHQSAPDAGNSPTAKSLITCSNAPARAPLTDAIIRVSSPGGKS